MKTYYSETLKQNVTIPESEHGDEIHNAAVQLGKLGGRAKSERKTLAVRENGKAGGRPPKTEKVIFDQTGTNYHVVVIDTGKPGFNRYMTEIEQNGLAYTPDEESCFASRTEAIQNAKEWVAA